VPARASAAELTTGTFMLARVWGAGSPGVCPLGSRGMDGRIDDPNAGWKGRTLRANYGTHFVWHIEGGQGVLGNMVKFRLRPDPPAR
jgi:hypothetical protein